MTTISTIEYYILVLTMLLFQPTVWETNLILQWIGICLHKNQYIRHIRRKKSVPGVFEKSFTHNTRLDISSSREDHKVGPWLNIVPIRCSRPRNRGCSSRAPESTAKHCSCPNARLLARHDCNGRSMWHHRSDSNTGFKRTRSFDDEFLHPCRRRTWWLVFLNAVLGASLPSKRI